MEKSNYKQTKKDFIGDVLQYTKELKKKGKQPGVRACRRICKNTFGKDFSLMASLLQKVVIGNFQKEIQLYLNGKHSDKEFIKNIRMHVIDWFDADRFVKNKLKLID